MSKVTLRASKQPSISSKLHKYIKEQPHVNLSLIDIQRGLSNIGISLSKRVIESREKR
ncbi:MAG: hypothetical protein AABY44_03605 [Nitrospirota bacterium]